MVAILVRVPEELLAEIDELAEETHSNRSVFIRQACARHIHVLRAVELPAVRAYYTKLLPKACQ